MDRRESSDYCFEKCPFTRMSQSKEEVPKGSRLCARQVAEFMKEVSTALFKKPESGFTAVKVLQLVSGAELPTTPQQYNAAGRAWAKAGEDFDARAGLCAEALQQNGCVAPQMNEIDFPTDPEITASISREANVQGITPSIAFDAAYKATLNL